MFKINLCCVIDLCYVKMFDMIQLCEKFLIDKFWIEDDISLIYI